MEAALPELVHANRCARRRDHCAADPMELAAVIEPFGHPGDVRPVFAIALRWDLTKQEGGLML